MHSPGSFPAFGRLSLSTSSIPISRLVANCERQQILHRRDWICRGRVSGGVRPNKTARRAPLLVLRTFHSSRKSWQDITSTSTHQPSNSASQRASASSSPISSYSSSPASEQSQSQPQAEDKPRRSRARSIVNFILIAVISATFGFAMAAAPALQTASEMLSLPTDEESLLLFDPEPDHPSAAINAFILSHPLTKALEADPRFVASRPHLKIPPSLRPHNFTGGTLLGADKIPVPPLTFATPDGTALVSIQYLGHSLCGHPGVVHGGLLATLLDEGLARCCFPALPHKVGVTASLKIDYRKPCHAGQYVVLRSETTKVEGRKAWVKGRLEVLNPDGSDGDVLVEAEALFVEPKQAASMARVYSGQAGISAKKEEKREEPKVQVNGATVPNGVQVNGVAK